MLKAAATSVRSVGSKCFLSVFYIGKLPVFFLDTNSTQIYVVPSFLEEGILCTTEEIHSLNGYVDQIWEIINTVTGTPIIGANFQLSSVMTQVFSCQVLF